jgi:hypothetical protein
MNPATNPVEVHVSEVRLTFETETTIGRILTQTKKSLERFLATALSSKLRLGKILP